MATCLCTISSHLLLYVGVEGGFGSGRAGREEGQDGPGDGGGGYLRVRLTPQVEEE